MYKVRQNFNSNSLVKKASTKGFSIIDLLVGVAIALLTMTVMVNSTILSDRQKKQTTSVSDVQTAGQIASYYLNRDMRMAGYGITQDGLQNCVVNAYNGNTGSNFSFSLMPIRITAGGGPLVSDSINIFYGDADITSTVSKLTAANNGTNANYRVDNRYGMSPGDLLVLYSPSVDSNSDGTPDCSMAETTGVPGTSGQTNVVIHNTGNYSNPYTGTNTSAVYNKPAGIGISYPSGTQVLNIGNAPSSYTYTTNASNTLIRTNNLTGAQQDLGENVVALKAYYIKDTNSDGIADTLDQTTPTGSNAWKQIVGIRYSVVTRSVAREENPITSITVVPAVRLPNGTTSTAVTASLAAAEQFYRYRVYSSTVTLRNVIWKDS